MRLAALDELMDVLLPVREFRQASRSIGRSFLRAAARVRPAGLAERGVEHHAVVFGAVLRGLASWIWLTGWRSTPGKPSASNCRRPSVWARSASRRCRTCCIG